jgi:hypothetical protein
MFHRKGSMSLCSEKACGAIQQVEKQRFSKAPKFGSPSFVLHSTKLPFAYGHRYNLLSLYYVEEEMQDLQTVGF